jgi:hypothetical protein
MGHEFVGECFADPETVSQEMELAIKYIKHMCGETPPGVDVQITYEDHELGSYPVISVVWDDYVTGYPEDYIQKCIEAFERFDLPEEIHQQQRDRASLFREIQTDMEKLFEPD